MMCTGHTGKRKRRKLYGWLKRKYSKQRKIDAKGTGNSQHRTMWINKIGTTENKKISIGDVIPDGWVKGRILLDRKSLNNCKVCGNLSGNKVFCSTDCRKKSDTYITSDANLERTKKAFNLFVSENLTLRELHNKYGYGVNINVSFKKHMPEQYAEELTRRSLKK